MRGSVQNRRANGPGPWSPQIPPSVVKMENESPKNHPWAPFLYTSIFTKAIYKYFNYFGPWTADVQGPPLNSPMMIVIMTILNDRPVPTRAQPRPLVARASSPAGCGGVSPPPSPNPACNTWDHACPKPSAQSLPFGPNFKFLELFAPLPGQFPEKIPSHYPGTY
jgi:hypothetical protein